MNINKHNYEAFFLDYHEGNLSPQQVAELLLFVEQHPQLREEFESFENISLDSFSEAVYKNKEYLKKDLIITKLNYEEFFVRAIENDLNTEEQKALQKFLEEHPLLLKEYKLFGKTILEQDNSVVFAQKEELKRMPVTTDHLLISSVEGLLAPAEKELLEIQLMADSQMRHELELFKQTKIKADLNIVYPDKEELKRRSRRAVPVLFYYAAAALILLLGLTVVLKQNNGSTISPEFSAKENLPQNQTEVAPLIPKALPEKTLAAEPKVAVKKNSSPQEQQERKKDSVTVPVINAPENNIALQVPVQEEIIPNTVVETPVNAPVALAPKKTEAEESQYLSLTEIAALKIKEKTLDADAIAMQKKSGKMKRMSGWDVLQIMAKGVSKVTGKDVAVKPTYNEEGEVTAYAFNAGKLGFSRER